ncbi:MAG: O-antigen ligase family protein, partial [Actinomycetota bacterium]|nr:O-antigen ligase family protein [Actinomycetota bacterium]
LTLADPRRRATAMLVALALSAAVVLTEVGGEIARRPALAAVGVVAGAVVVVALALLLRRAPSALPLLVVGALPFRVPLPVGGGTASLLVPLYVVIAAGCLATAAGWLGPRHELPPDRWRRRLELALAAVLVLYALQALSSTDPGQAVRNVALFYAPFALLFRLVLDVPWSRRLVLGALGVAAGLALVFAAVGYVEYATRHLLLFNPKVMAANEVKPYFRVNSLFFDPNMYGRFLALTMVGLTGALLWSRRARDAGLLAAALLALWGGLVLSLSQSSFAALLLGLAVLAALRWRALPVVLAVVVAGAAAVGLVAVAPQALRLDPTSERSLDRATSGRVDLVQGGVAMFRDRPVLGFGSGSFAERYRAREGVTSATGAAASHTIPLTVAAEQGVVGFVAYLALLWATLGLAFARLRRALRRDPDGVVPVARAALAAMLLALVLHTLVYAAFLEDPATWALLALAAALRGVPPEPGPAVPAAVPPAAEPVPAPVL